MLQKVNFLPGFNKQVTPTGAEGSGREEITYVLDMVPLKK